MEEFKDYYRFKLYEKTNILVNKLDDVFKENIYRYGIETIIGRK